MHPFTSDVSFRVAAKALTASQKLEQPILIWGLRGIGKTALVQRFIDFMPSGTLIDIGPALALGDKAMIRTMIGALQPDAKGVLLVDDVHLAKPDLLAEVLPQLLKGTFGSLTLPSGMLVCVVGYGITAPPALPDGTLDRLTEIHLVPDVNDWIAWGYDTRRIPPVILSFLRLNPDLLCLNETNTRANPLNWEAVAKVYSDASLPTEAREAMVVGRIGMDVAAKLSVFEEEFARLTALEQISAGHVDGLDLTIPSLFAFAYQVAGQVNDLDTARTAFRTIVALTAVGQRQKALPIPEVQMLMAELILDRCVKGGFSNELAATPEFQAYLEQRPFAAL